MNVGNMVIYLMTFIGLLIITIYVLIYLNEDKDITIKSRDITIKSLNAHIDKINIVNYDEKTKYEKEIFLLKREIFELKYKK